MRLLLALLSMLGTCLGLNAFPVHRVQRWLTVLDDSLTLDKGGRVDLELALLFIFVLVLLDILSIVKDR